MCNFQQVSTFNSPPGSTTVKLVLLTCNQRSRITTPYNEPKTDFYSVSCQYVEYNVPWAKPIIKAPKIDLTSTPTGTNSSTTVNGKQSCKNI